MDAAGEASIRGRGAIGDRQAPRAPDDFSSWRRLTPADLAALFLLVIVTFWLAGPRLPRGLCVGDAGDLQLAGAVWGIPHPPGYAAYVTLAHFATLLPGVDPAFAVSMACLSVGVLVVLLGALLPIRLGVNGWISSAVAMTLPAQPRVWLNMTTPEVYIFSVAFLLGAVYVMTRYVRRGRPRDVLLAAFLLGVAIANRPPVVLASPFFIWAWWTCPTRPRGSAAQSARTFGLIALAASLPGVYSLGYFYLRDHPGTAYNYVEHYNTESRDLPESTDGWRAKAERVFWLVSARQFHDHVGNDWRRIRAKMRWLYYELVGYELVVAPAIGVLAAVGAFVVLRRSAPTLWLLFGAAFQTVVYVLNYRDSGQAADLLPLLVAVWILLAFGGGLLFPSSPRGPRSAIAVLLFAATTSFAVQDAPHRPRYGESVDAGAFLRETDLATLPPRSVIFTQWTYAVPLIYEQQRRAKRDDVKVVIAQPGNWLKMAAEHPDRPVYLTKDSAPVRSHELTPFRNLWLLGPERPAKE